MNVSYKKSIFIIGVCLLVVISIFLSIYLIKINSDNRLVTGEREELKSITIQIYNENESAEKAIIISDIEHMYSIYDHLSSTSTIIKMDNPQTKGNVKILLTYSYPYDDQSGKQDVVFWETDSNFYCCKNNGYVFGRSTELQNLLNALLGTTELKMVGENQGHPKKIIIREYKGIDVESTITLTDTEKINFIFSNLGTIETRAILYPGEMSGLALDTEYELILEYDEQEDIVIFTGTETANTFYRYTKTISSSGEEGYVYGENSVLYDYIVNLLDTAQ